MRNIGSKLHLPSREWKKVVRFNSCDYILRSVYDGSDRKRKLKYITTTKDVDSLTDTDDYTSLLEYFFNNEQQHLNESSSKKDIDTDEFDFGSDDEDDFFSNDDDDDNFFSNNDEEDIEQEPTEQTYKESKPTSVNKPSIISNTQQNDDEDDDDDNFFDNDDDVDFDDTTDKTEQESSGIDDSVWDHDDSFNDNTYGVFDDICSQMQQDAVDAVFNSTEYRLTKENGEELPVRLSENTYVNAIYYVIEPLVLIANDVDAQTHKTIDTFMYASGRRNNKVSYKIDINNIYYKDGTLKFIIGGERPLGFIHVYYVDAKNIDFTIKYPGINMNGKKDTVVLNYSLFCHLIDCNPLTMSKKQPVQYFKPIVTELMEQFKSKNIGIKLLRRHPALTFNSLSSASNSPATFKDNFDIVANYGEKEYGDVALMKSAVDESCAMLLGIFYNSFNWIQDFIDDENYVIIGGNEKFFSEYIHSSINNFVSGSSFINIQFKTPDPNNRVRKIEHNMMLMPLSRFMIASPSMLLMLLSNQR